MIRGDMKYAFWEAAEKHSCWISLRRPNESAFQWIGQGNYIGKPASCGAKTADNGVHPFAGLVVDPRICPTAYKDQLEAIKKWNDAFPNGLPFHFWVNTFPEHKGKLMYSGDPKYPKGAFLHADFDLMSIVPVKKDGSKIAYSGHIPEPKKGRKLPDYQGDALKLERLGKRIQSTINALVGSIVVQHGPEFLYWDIGAAPSEYLLWFGPRGECEVRQSSFYMDIKNTNKDKRHLFGN